MPLSSRVKIPYPATNKDNWYSDFVAMINAIDLKLYGNREDRNIILMEGGVFTLAVSGNECTLSWDGIIEILSSTTGFVWRVAAGSITLQNNQMMYVNLVRAPSDNTTLTIQKGDTIPHSDNDLVIGVFRTDRIYFRNGDVIFDGESYELFSQSTGTIGLSNTTPATLNVGDAGSAGLSTNASRADHQHPLNTAAVGDLTALDAGAASAGVSTKIPRADHKHTISTAAPGNISFGSASAGVATSLARSDHSHGMSSGTPSATGTTNSEGVSTSPARVDHVHRTGLIVSTSGSVAGTRPQIDFSDQAFSLTDDGGTDRVNIKTQSDICVFIQDKPDASDVVLRMPMNRTISFPANMTGSRASAEVASTGTVTFSIRDGTTEFATLTFTASATGVFTAASPTTLTNTSVLRIIAPNPQDATLSDIGINLAFTK